MPSSPTPRPARVSLRDVARAVGVSHVTISLALRDDPRISAPRRIEIRTAAEKLGYRPDPMLSSLAAYRQSKQGVGISSTIAWINQWPDPKALRRLREFEAYWKGATDAAATLGYRLEEFVIGGDLSNERLHHILTARGVRGILVPPHAHGLSMPGFDWSAFSVVRLGLSVSQLRAHVVTSDQLNCAKMAFDQVRERGYQRIGYVSSRRFDRDTGGNFRAGFLTAQDVVLPLREHLPPLYLEEETSPAVTRALDRWLKAEKPDAIITTHAALADLLTRLGIQVPGDVAVAALSVLDGNFDAGVDQNSFEVGQVAIRTLAGLIHQNERGIPRYCRRILVEGRWLDGSSLPNRLNAAPPSKEKRRRSPKALR
jgi:LacI family transcriptional regulator